MARRSSCFSYYSIAFKSTTSPPPPDNGSIIIIIILIVVLAAGASSAFLVVNNRRKRGRREVTEKVGIDKKSQEKPDQKEKSLKQVTDDFAGDVKPAKDLIISKASETSESMEKSPVTVENIIKSLKDVKPRSKPIDQKQKKLTKIKPPSKLPELAKKHSDISIPSPESPELIQEELRKIIPPPKSVESAPVDRPIKEKIEETLALEGSFGTEIFQTVLKDVIDEKGEAVDSFLTNDESFISDLEYILQVVRKLIQAKKIELDEIEFGYALEKFINKKQIKPNELELNMFQQGLRTLEKIFKEMILRIDLKQAVPGKPFDVQQHVIVEERLIKEINKELKNLGNLMKKKKGKLSPTELSKLRQEFQNLESFLDLD